MNLLDWKGWFPASRPALSRGWRDGWMGGIGSDHGQVPASYGERVRAAYGANPLAQRACRLVAGAVGDAPLGIDGDAAMAARIGALIGARSGGVALLETVALHLVLHGNAYVQLVDAGDGSPSALYALRPDKVVVELGSDGWPTGYAYGVGAERRLIPAEDAHGRPALVHLRSGHPLDDHYGMGCLDAAIGAVVLHNEASRWNRGLIANAARPSGALVHDPAERGATLTAAQFERLACAPILPW